MNARALLVAPLVGWLLLNADPLEPRPGAAAPRAAAAMAAEPFTIEYYYKAKWGFAAEFIRLFKRNYLPVLEEMEREGRILSIVAHAPRHHATEDGRWDWRVSVTWRDAIAAHEDHHPEEIVARLFPDRDRHADEERRRFEILLAHWDVLIEEQELHEDDDEHGSASARGPSAAAESQPSSGPPAERREADAASAASARDRSNEALARVVAIHGGAGPFVLAGMRMGERALAELGLDRGDPRLDVLHRTPEQVQWSCIVDGLQAATGTSPGKLDLRLEIADGARAESVVSRRASGLDGSDEPERALTFRLRDRFVERFLDTPPAERRAACRAVLELPDDEIFEVAAGLAR